MQDEQFKKTILETKLKSEAQEKMITLLHFLLTQHYSQCYKYQRQLILNHIKQCQAMISDLNYVLKVLPPTTTPTLEECQKQIRLWKEELKTTNEKAALYHESCQQVFTNLYIGIYTPFPEPVDLPTHGFQLRDILCYSSHALVNSMIRDQQFYQQQYAARNNNYGRCQHRGSIAATPYSYNRPDASQNRRACTTRQPETNRNIDTSSQIGPSTDKVEKMAQSFSRMQVNVNSNTNRKLDNNDTPKSQKDQEKIKADTLSSNTSCSDNCLELKAIKNAVDVLLGCMEKFLTKTNNSLNLKLKTDEVLGNTLKQSVAKPFDQTVAYSSNNALEPKLHQATKPFVAAGSESKPDIIDKASKLSDETADSFANNNWLVPAKTSAYLKRLQGETAKTQFVREYTELKPANISKQPHVHNQRDIKHQLPAVKSSNINPQPGPSTVKDYSSEYQSSQKAELSHFNRLVEKKPDNASTTIVKLLNKPRFNSLFTYIKNKIPGRKDDELLLAIKTVRERKSKLSGMTRESIVAAVCEELNRTNSELTTCVICIKMFGDSPISTLQCHHSFHAHCIQQWFVSNIICPVCRFML